MLFSIVIPVYNAEKTIRFCLDSIISQDFSDFEVVVINDGSTDQTAEILATYSALDPRIKVHHFANAGVSIARQRGISLSSGDYILFVDSDDTINPGLFANIASAIVNFDNPDIIRYQCKLIGDAPHKDHERYNFNSYINIPMNGMEALKTWSIEGKKYALYWLFAFKRDIFRDVTFLTSLKCHEDVALLPVLIAKAAKVITTDFCGYNYYCSNATSLSNVRSPEAEKSRAIDFWKAYIYAIANFLKIGTASTADMLFFVTDYNRRLRNKYNSLSESLKEELAELYRIH